MIGSGRNWAANAWGEANKMWRAHGERNHLLLPTEEAEVNLRHQADKYRAARRLTADMPLPPSEDNADLKEGWKAARFLFLYEASRQVSAFRATTTGRAWSRTRKWSGAGAVLQGARVRPDRLDGEGAADL